MTVRELIKLLEQENPEHRVVQSGYEGGLSDFKPPRRIRLMLDVNKPSYFGPHEECPEGGIPAVHFNRDDW